MTRCSDMMCRVRLNRSNYAYRRIIITLKKLEEVRDLFTSQNRELTRRYPSRRFIFVRDFMTK